MPMGDKPPNQPQHQTHTESRAAGKARKRSSRAARAQSVRPRQTISDDDKYARSRKDLRSLNAWGCSLRYAPRRMWHTIDLKPDNTTARIKIVFASFVRLSILAGFFSFSICRVSPSISYR